MVVVVVVVSRTNFPLEEKEEKVVFFFIEKQRKKMDQFHHQHSSGNRAGHVVPKFYQRSQSVVERNGGSTSAEMTAGHHQNQQPEWPGPPVPVRSERRGAFRRRVSGFFFLLPLLPTKETSIFFSIATKIRKTFFLFFHFVVCNSIIIASISFFLFFPPVFWETFYEHRTQDLLFFFGVFFTSLLWGDLFDILKWVLATFCWGTSPDCQHGKTTTFWAYFRFEIGSELCVSYLITTDGGKEN